MRQTQNFAGGTKWGKVRLFIREPETASDLKMYSVVFDNPRYVHVMKTSCFIATLDYLNG